MPPRPLNPDGTLNTDRLYYEVDRDSKQSSKKSTSKSTAKKKADTDDVDKQIKLLRDAMKEASGFKRRELEARLEEAKADRESRIRAAEIGADASRYGSDKSLEGTKYSSDADERNSQRSLEGTKYSSDAGERNAQRSLEGTRYSADSSAAASRYGTDADLYRFNAEQPLKRGEQALGFLKTYTDLSARPDSFIQASNYGRLGYQVEGMPGMMADLLGNVNPNGAPVGGNIAFRGGTGPMPQTAGQAIFGANPLNLGTRAAAPAMPTWMGPPGGASGGGGMMSAAFAAPSYGASYGSGDHRGKLVSDAYGAQAGLPLTMTPAPQAARVTATHPDGYPYAVAGLTDDQPRVMTQGVVPTNSSTEDQFVANTRELMRRGAHQLGGQALERLTQTERDMLASGIKANGGIPADFFESYQRSRIDNSSSGRAL